MISRLSLLLLFLFATAGHSQRYVKPLNTFSDLASANVADLNTNAFLVGGSSPGDGYQGIFTYLSTSVAPASSNQVIVPNSGTGRWFRQTSPTLSGTIVSSGSGGVFKTLVGSDSTGTNAVWRSIVGGTNVTITTNSTGFTISTGPSGIAGTIVSGGSGGIFKTLVGMDSTGTNGIWRDILAGSNITVTTNSSGFTISSVAGGAPGSIVSAGSGGIFKTLVGTDSTGTNGIWRSILGGSNITITTNSSGFTIAGQPGTVTSVGLTVPSGFSVSGSPITSSGTLAISESNVGTNVVKAGPNGGASGAPTYRQVDVNDLSAAGTKNSTTFLRGDNAWGVPPGVTNTATFADPTGYVGLSPSNGVSTDGLRSDVWLPLHQGIAPVMTNTWTFRNQTNPVSIQYDATNKLDITVSSGGVATFTPASGTNRFVGIADASVGFTQAGVATSGKYLRGNGTIITLSDIDGGDVATGTVLPARLPNLSGLNGSLSLNQLSTNGAVSNDVVIFNGTIWTNGTTSGSGTVTSVALTPPGDVFDVVGSPVTTSGNLQFNFINQVTNTFLAGPTNSSDLTQIPRFRSIIPDDIPTHLLALTKLDTNGAALNDIITFNGTDWTNAAASASGGGNVTSSGTSTTNMVAFYSDTTGTNVVPIALTNGSGVTFTRTSTNLTISASGGSSISGTANVIAKFDSTGTNLSNSLIEDNTTSLSVQPRTNNVTTLGTSLLRYANVYSVNMAYNGQLTSTIGSGTPPMVISSSTEVANLNVQKLGGHTSDYYNPFFVLGDVAYGDASGNPVRLIGQGTTNIAFYAQKGTGNAYPNQSAAPFWSTLTAGTNVVFTYTSTNVIINSSASGSSGTAGTMIHSGSSAEFKIPVSADSTGTNWTSKDILAGSNITVTTNSSGFTIAGQPGTVTSVAQTVPTNEFSIAGSPITSSGTLAITKQTQTANTVWAGPTSGSAAQPAFRALVLADVPNGTTFAQGSGSINFTNLGSGNIFQVPSGKRFLICGIDVHFSCVLDTVGSAPDFSVGKTGDNDFITASSLGVDDEGGSHTDGVQSYSPTTGPVWTAIDASGGAVQITYEVTTAATGWTSYTGEIYVRGYYY